MKKVLIVAASPRKNGNSDLLALQFAKGAEEAGNEVETDYSVSGQMKVFLDRMNPLYERMKDKDFYYIVTAADTDKKQLDRAFDAFDGFADCFENIRLCGRIYGGGADKKGEVMALAAYTEAYEIGKTV